MNKTKFIASVVLFFALFAWQAAVQSKSGHDSGDALVNMPDALLDQARLYKLLVESEISEAARSLVHVSHTCSLTINHKQYPVIDMRELIKGAVVPRGVNQIIVLNPEYQLVQRIEYGQARPMFCENDKLYLYDSLIVDGQSKEGNVLRFEESGFKVIVLKEDLNKKLPLKNKI